MRRKRIALALIASAATASGFGASPVAARQATAPARSAAAPSNQIVLTGTVKFWDESDVAALREGVLKEIEFNVGDRIEAGQEIGRLHDEVAQLKLARQDVAASSTGAIDRARAQKQLAMSDMARLERLKQMNPQNVTPSETDLAKSRLNAAVADEKAAEEEIKLARADRDLAQRELDEQIIRAPFTGYITNRMKDPGEAVQANEPVIRLGRTDRLRFFGYLPLESAVRIRLGDQVEVQAEVADGDLAVEQIKFPGRVVAIGQEASTVGRTEVIVHAQIDNTADEVEDAGVDGKLLSGLKARMTIHLGTGDGKRPASVARAQPAPNAGAAALPVLPAAGPR
jgi:RND family efflux transporter MFP subunit